MAKYGGPPKEGTTKICAECGEKFSPAGGAQVSCSPKCKRDRNNRQQREGRTGLTVKQVVCRKCGNLFTKTAPTQKTCDTCLSQRKVGVGTGNYQKEDAPIITEVKVAKPNFSRSYLIHLQENGIEWKCEECGVNLEKSIAANDKRWGVHHKDQNHFNDALGNLELLCVTCHLQAHNFNRHFL